MENLIIGFLAGLVIFGLLWQFVLKNKKDENKDQSRQIGFIAQDVEKIFPELVKTDDKGYKSMNYSKVVTVLVESVKELDDENQELEDRIVKLENMVETLLNEESSDRD